ncbi:ABC transporter substrate binding protein [Oscillospiraceae bacterium LTW-04]|nr:ABC transporter substrate-binding protein [Oscillospiraceae bacterium MB24-C1]
MKKFLVLILAATVALSLVACGNTSGEAAASTKSPQASNAASTSNADTVFNIGICQLVQHEALDAATKGFKDALSEKLGDKVVFDEQNAAGDSTTCSTICNQFVSNNYDLILGNATPALQAAVSSTNTIPVLGTSITDYATALDIDNWTGVTGYNVSGTSDLAPLDKQAEMIKELFPNAKNIGILYCSAEANSKYQVETIGKYLTEMGYTLTEYTFADTNDVTAVAQNACLNSDVIYIPTDNTAASCTEAINNVAESAGIPVVCGEEGACKGCGIATLSIRYYDIGYTTGEMAYEILVNGADVSTMEVQYASETTYKYMPDRAEKLGVKIPGNYTAIESK